jgi:tRNA(His) guanylyltransferase
LIGESDEFSFIIRRISKMFNRRQNKITSLIVSSFTSAFVYYWSKYFSNTSSDGIVESVKLEYPPAFDGRCILYPNEKLVMDYLKWRQVDCHINNLYNTTFYALTGQYTKYPLISHNFDNLTINKLTESIPKPKPLTAREATDRLSGTSSSDKHEILFQEFGINYNNELEQFKKGTVLLLDIPEELSKTMSRNNKEKKLKNKNSNQSCEQSDNEEPDIEPYISTLNVDLIGEKFWNQYKKILS